MNKLSLSKRVQIINLLVEGSSLRATSRIADVSINTVTKLLIEAGIACEKFHNETVMFVKPQRIQCDEIWSFVYSKQKNVPEGMEEGVGDVWTWTCIDADSKLIISWLVGNRDSEAAHLFMNDVATRVKGKPGQITTDGLHEYQSAVLDAFGSQINFAQLVKQYAHTLEYVGERNITIEMNGKQVPYVHYGIRVTVTEVHQPKIGRGFICKDSDGEDIIEQDQDGYNLWVNEYGVRRLLWPSSKKEWRKVAKTVAS